MIFPGMQTNIYAHTNSLLLILFTTESHLSVVQDKWSWVREGWQMCIDMTFYVHKEKDNKKRVS